MDLNRLSRAIERCEKCPRLRRHCLSIAETKRRSYSGEKYWGKPIVGFGDSDAELVIIGLAPAAHGANRTGRIFTGDRSADWLYRALYKAGFSNQAHSVSKNDGLKLKNCFISCVVKCAPPGNKPSPAEIATCSQYLTKEIEFLAHAKVYLALGNIALQGVWPILKTQTQELPRKPKFSHGGVSEFAPGKYLLTSYHPSQQNTFTGRLTEPMFDAIFTRAKTLLK